MVAWYLACTRLALLLIVLLASGKAVADPDPDATSYKLTLGSYRFPGGGSGTDINLRQSSTLGNLWFGYFKSAQQEIDQWRAGWDHTYGEQIRVMPSLQVASHNFAGGSLQAETGDPWFIGAGIGRTNLKTYWNLNFDPNDSYTLSAGHRTDHQTLALQYIRDNRENPDQRHLHFVWRQSLPDRQRLTADLLYKQGLVNDETIHRWGVGITYDWPSFFLRIAYDPKANFGPDNLWRFSIGARF